MIICAAWRHIAGHKYSILADDLNIAPLDVKIVIAPEQPEKPRSAVYDDAAYLSGAAVELHIVGVAEPRARFHVDYLFAPQIVEAVYHNKTPHSC